MPMTASISKQLLPVYDKPMIYYPLTTLMLAGITEILVITSPEHQNLIKQTIEKIGNIGVRFCYEVQQNPNGIAEALIIGEEFLGGDPCALILGDNLFFGNGMVSLLKIADTHAEGAHIFSYKVKNPSDYGIVEIDSEGNIVQLVEKPKKYLSDLAITGLYFFDGRACEYAKKLKPSDRNELEITDLNQAYLNEGNLSCHKLGRGFTWLDMGTPSSLLDAANFVATVERRQGIKIASPEEVAWRKGFLSDEDLRRLPMLKSNDEYGQYILGMLRK
jgi:glucose-1-phosphate thymidylyltransferase